MTAQEYIELKLRELKEPRDLPRPQNQDELINTIFGLLTSKKFRKYSLTPEYSTHIRNSIIENVKSNQPINVTFLGGSYKLWRLGEAPESDWAELFACMYYTRWLKDICSIYEPGAWFDFMLDDVIVARLNNLDEADVSAYRESRDKVLSFLKPYQPANLKMTITGVGSLFESHQVYESKLEKALQDLTATLPGGIPELSDAQLATTELNTKATPEQLKDPKWREKVELLHMAYMNTKGATGYSTASNKIRAFTQPFPNGTCIAVGSTKDSVAKFWVGVGSLKPREDGFRQIILSPKQLAAADFEWQEVSIDKLSGKNFSRIRVLK
jgi:hypothetical protein